MNSRHRVSSLVALGLALAAARPARGGGIWEPDPKFEAAQARADARATRWRAAGAAAVPEIAAALCRGDDPLRTRAAEVLEELGRAAIHPLIEAAARPGACDVEPALAEILCHAGGNAELAAMLGDVRPTVAAAARGTLQHVVDTNYGHSCHARAELVTAALPGLRALARTRSGKELEDTLWTIERIGPEAAPLVPELVAALDKEDIAGNFAAASLEAIGPAAAPAVPKLTTLLRSGGKWSFRAVQALGGIGPAAAPALADFRPVLAAAGARVCETPGTYGEPDVTVESVLRAAASIGGSGVEPLVPALVAAFPRMRACRVARPEDWFKWLGALRGHGDAAADMLLGTAENADEPLRVRKEALAALDEIGPRFTWWLRLRRLRKAIRRKDELFTRHDRADQGGEPQMLPQPPPPPLVPLELGLCRAEADLPSLPLEARSPVAPAGNEQFGDCVRERLCGPDEATYRATLAACCRGYAAPRPSFCAASAPLP